MRRLLSLNALRRPWRGGHFGRDRRADVHLQQPVPSGVLTPGATLQPPPNLVAARDLVVKAVPEAWQDSTSTAFGVSPALSRKFDKHLPKAAVRDTMDAGIWIRWMRSPKKARCDRANSPKPET